MHKSNDENNFRNGIYLKEMENEFKKLCLSYFKYVSYRNKLKKELTMSENDKLKINILDKKFIKYIRKMFNRINKEDFKDVL